MCMYLQHDTAPFCARVALLSSCPQEDDDEARAEHARSYGEYDPRDDAGRHGAPADASNTRWRTHRPTHIRAHARARAVHPPSMCVCVCVRAHAARARVSAAQEDVRRDLCLVDERPPFDIGLLDDQAGTTTLLPPRSASQLANALYDALYQDYLDSGVGCGMVATIVPLHPDGRYGERFDVYLRPRASTAFCYEQRSQSWGPDEDLAALLQDNLQDCPFWDVTFEALEARREDDLPHDRSLLDELLGHLYTPELNVPELVLAQTTAPYHVSMHNAMPCAKDRAMAVRIACIGKRLAERYGSHTFMNVWYNRVMPLAIEPGLSGRRDRAKELEKAAVDMTYFECTVVTEDADGAMLVRVGDEEYLCPPPPVEPARWKYPGRSYVDLNCPHLALHLPSMVDPAHVLYTLANEMEVAVDTGEAIQVPPHERP